MTSDQSFAIAYPGLGNSEHTVGPSKRRKLEEPIF
jgi:hypothetical protein